MAPAVDGGDELRGGHPRGGDGEEVKEGTSTSTPPPPSSSSDPADAASAPMPSNAKPKTTGGGNEVEDDDSLAREKLSPMVSRDEISSEPSPPMAADGDGPAVEDAAGRGVGVGTGDGEGGDGNNCGHNASAATIDADDDGGRVDLYNEVESCLDDSELIYEICEVRRLVREGKIDVADALVGTGTNLLAKSISLAEGCRIIRENEEVLMRALGRTDYDTCVGRLDNYMKRSRERMERIRRRRGISSALDDDSEVGDGVILVEVGDMHQHEELVYYIVVDHHHRLVKVVFRGSATLADFQTDAHLAMRKIPNPVPIGMIDVDEEAARGDANDEDVDDRPRSEPSKDGERAPRSIKIHAGFYQYLFARPREAGETSWAAAAAKTARMVPGPGPGPRFDKNGMDEADGRDERPPTIVLPTKCDYILNQTACILRENPGYRLFTTGHSLGGALSTLFAFEAATVAAAATEGGDDDDHRRVDIPTPVTCINVASPMVGNVAFCRAFRSLEERGLLRQLRVVNVEDLVPRGPTRGVMNDFGFLCRLRNVYRHVGMKLQLSAELELEPSYVITYHDVPNHFVLFCVVLITDVQRIFLMLYLCVCGCLCYRGLRLHSCDEYWDRIRANRDELEKLTLDDLYDSVLRGGKRGIIHRGGKDR